MTERDWQTSGPVVGMFLNGEEIAAPDARGRPILDESFLVLFNAHHEDCTFTLPNRRFGVAWTLVLDTADPGLEPGAREVAARQPIDVVARSVILLRRAG
jgi:glycogen operon protein